MEPAYPGYPGKEAVIQVSVFSGVGWPTGNAMGCNIKGCSEDEKSSYLWHLLWGILAPNLNPKVRAA